MFLDLRVLLRSVCYLSRHISASVLFDDLNGTLGTFDCPFLWIPKLSLLTAVGGFVESPEVRGKLY